MKVINKRRRTLYGREFTLHQFANDWMTVKEDPKVILRPTDVQLTPEEADRVRMTDGHRSVGLFWSEWVLRADGTFTRRT
jgi:hypothetical protein